MGTIRTNDAATMLKLCSSSLIDVIKRFKLTVIEVTNRVRFFLVSELEALTGMRIIWDRNGVPALVDRD